MTFFTFLRNLYSHTLPKIVCILVRILVIRVRNFCGAAPLHARVLYVNGYKKVTNRLAFLLIFQLNFLNSTARNATFLLIMISPRFFLLLKLLDFTNSTGLSQVVKEPTHYSYLGTPSTIDLIFVPSNLSCPSFVLPPLSSSDHNLLLFIVPLRQHYKPSSSKSTVLSGVP